MQGIAKVYRLKFGKGIRNLFPRLQQAMAEASDQLFTIQRNNKNERCVLPCPLNGKCRRYWYHVYKNKPIPLSTHNIFTTVKPTSQSTYITYLRRYL